MNAQSLFTPQPQSFSNEIHVRPRLSYNEAEQRLSAHVQDCVEKLVDGKGDDLQLMKLYPQRNEQMSLCTEMVRDEKVHNEILVQLAEGTLNYFGNTYGGVIAQRLENNIIIQSQRFSTMYPHINLVRYDFYDQASEDPLLSTWFARRIQNQLRETKKNRTLDTALLVLEVAKSLFPLVA